MLADWNVHTLHHIAEAIREGVGESLWIGQWVRGQRGGRGLAWVHGLVAITWGLGHGVLQVKPLIPQNAFYSVSIAASRVTTAGNCDVCPVLTTMRSLLSRPYWQLLFFMEYE